MLLNSPFNVSAAMAEAEAFISRTFVVTGKKTALIAVSGGIDSAVSLALTVRALGADHVIPIFLPYENQDMTDAHAAAAHAQISKNNWVEVNIAPLVAAATQAIPDWSVASGKKTDLRLGNIMARMRMIILFDQANKNSGLVVGTENKSEKYLGYFTRYGDEASDLEPLQTFYKTQIRMLAEALDIPTTIRTKAPSAGLWTDQSDEAELGFSYDLADRVLKHYIDGGIRVRLDAGESSPDPDEIAQASQQIAVLVGEDVGQVGKVLERVESQWFKHVVPYHLSGN